MNQRPFSLQRLKLVPFLAFLAFAVGCGGGSSAETAPPAELPRFQEPRCDRYGRVVLFERYMVQNNVWNDAAATQLQCTTALWDGSSDVAGFVVDPVDIATPNETPASYPSIVYGWHFGPFYGPYTEARRVNEIDAISSEWHFTVPENARYNAAYDLWFNSEPTPADASGAVEMMIWLDYRDAGPIGEMVDLVSLVGAEWEVWRGPNSGFSTITYRRTERVSKAALDLSPFVDDAVSRGALAEEWYLLGVEAGFEVWRTSEALTTSFFKAEIR